MKWSFLNINTQLEAISFSFRSMQGLQKKYRTWQCVVQLSLVGCDERPAQSRQRDREPWKRGWLSWWALPELVSTCFKFWGDPRFGLKMLIDGYGSPILYPMIFYRLVIRVNHWQGMHYSKALWGDDACEFRPERWEQGAPHRQGRSDGKIGVSEKNEKWDVLCE